MLMTLASLGPVSTTPNPKHQGDSFRVLSVVNLPKAQRTEMVEGSGRSLTALSADGDQIAIEIPRPLHDGAGPAHK